MILGRRRGPARALQQKKLALDAQQLGKNETAFGLLARGDRLLDNGQPIGDIPSAAQGLSRLSQEYEGPLGEALFPKFVTAGTQQP